MKKFSLAIWLRFLLQLSQDVDHPEKKKREREMMNFSMSVNVYTVLAIYEI